MMWVECKTIKNKLNNFLYIILNYKYTGLECVKLSVGNVSMLRCYSLNKMLIFQFLTIGIKFRISVSMKLDSWRTIKHNNEVKY